MNREQDIEKSNRYAKYIFSSIAGLGSFYFFSTASFWGIVGGFLGLALAVFSAPMSYELLLKKLNKPALPNWSFWTILIVGFLGLGRMNAYVVGDLNEKIVGNNNSLLTNFDEALKKGDLQTAYNEIVSAEGKWQGDKKELLKLQEETKNVTNEAFMMQVLGGMTDDQVLALEKQGWFTMNYFKNKRLEELFFQSLKSNIGKRAEAQKLKSIADQKARKREAEEKAYLAQKQREHEANMAKENRKAFVEKQFSSYDGSHIDFVRAFKKNLNDPDSFEHVETKYIDNGTSLTVIMKYRAKNGFGAFVLQIVKANITDEGQMEW